MNAGRYSLLLLLVLLNFSAVAQKSKNQLQAEKQKNLQKIKEVEKILSETDTQKKNTLGELSALNQRIAAQENLIQSIKSETELLNKEIGEDNGIIAALEEDLKHMRKEYTAMLFAAQKANNSATRLTFLFSASSFDQLVMRMRYMKQYSALRKLQADQIIKTQDQLASQVKTTEAKRNEKNALLAEEVSENQQLSDLKSRQKTLVKNLERQEKKLRADLTETKNAVAKLDKLIDDLIREEIEKAAREEREAKARAAKNKTVAAPDASIALSASFEDNKNKFPWPANGFVSDPFGTHMHPILKGIVVKNEGVNIQTKQGEKVKCIFNGTVSLVAFVAGIGTVVMIKHGGYFTVYSGLKDVLVKNGQSVNTNQELGTVSANKDGVPELRFQIRKNTTPLDPQAWLRN
ncbi:MAG: peptidase M23 [Cytophagia bacterium]|nr:peptidase M23 [Cytophagia bacterium]